MRYIKIVLAVIGTVSATLGIIGIFLPLLPTTPFLLLAAACYARSSERLYGKLVNNKWLGTYIRNYFEGKGIPLKAKIVSVSMLWLAIGYSALFLVSILALKIVLILIAICVTIHIIRTKSLGKSDDRSK